MSPISGPSLVVTSRKVQVDLSKYPCGSQDFLLRTEYFIKNPATFQVLARNTFVFAFGLRNSSYIIMPQRFSFGVKSEKISTRRFRHVFDLLACAIGHIIKPSHFEFSFRCHACSATCGYSSNFQCTHRVEVSDSSRGKNVNK